MVNKKAQPNTADTMMVLINQIQTLGQNNKKLLQNFDDFDEKLNKIYQFNPKVNISDLQIENKSFLDNFRKENQKIFDNLINIKLGVDNGLQQEVAQINLNIANVKENISQNNFMTVVTFVAIFVPTILIINVSLKIENIAIVRQQQAQMKSSFEKYLIDNKQIDRYDRWNKKQK